MAKIIRSFQSQSPALVLGLLVLPLLLFLSPLWALQKNHAATYFVATTGSDEHSCQQAQSRSTPRASINGIAACVHPGDTVRVIAGEYRESVVNFPGGTSWEQPVTITADSYQPVWIRPEPGAANVFRFASEKSSYIILDSLALDASNVLYDGVKITYSSNIGRSSNIRFDYCLIRGAPSNGVYVNGPNVEFIDSEIRDNGTDHLTHGIYIAYSSTLVDGCLIKDNTGYGVHVYNLASGPVNNTLIRNNVIEGNGLASVTAGIILSSGAGHKAYDNIVYGNKSGIQVDYFAQGAQVYRNIIKDNQGSNGHCVVVGPGASQTLVGQNTCINNSYGVTDLGVGTQEMSAATIREALEAETVTTNEEAAG